MFFYNLFVQEAISEVPENIQEPAMQFLANGKDKLSRWLLYWISIVQRRIVTDKKEIEVQMGMILALKIFYNLVQKQQKPQQREAPKPTEPKKDFAAEVEAAIRELKVKSPEQ